MSTSPNPSTELLDASARRRAHRRRRRRAPGHLPADPAVRRRAHLPDLVDALQPEARAHRREPEGLALDHRPGRGRRPDRSGDDPGRRPRHRRRPARRLGAAAADLGGEGAGDRRFLKARVALPLFFERALIEITPRRVLYWSDGIAATAPQVTTISPGRRPRDGARDDRELDARPGSTSSRPIRSRSLTWVDDDGYPGQRRGRARPSTRTRGTRLVRAPAGLAVPTDATVSLTGSHIRPQPGYGYDERRHVTVWGRAPTGRRRRRHVRRPRGVGLGRGRGPVLRVLGALGRRSRGKYFDALSAERGTPVKPRLSFGLLALRTTRLPFLTRDDRPGRPRDR